MIASIVIDCILIVLLAVAIGYAIVVNRKLDALRAASTDMERLSSAFAESTARTEEGLSRLKVAARTTEEDRQRAEKLADDLRYLIERGDGLADRLEAAVKVARTSDRGVERSHDRGIERGSEPAVERPAPRRTRPPTKPAERWSGRGDGDDVPPRSQAERQLLEVLRASGLARAGASSR